MLVSGVSAVLGFLSLPVREITCCVLTIRWPYVQWEAIGDFQQVLAMI